MTTSAASTLQAVLENLQLEQGTSAEDIVQAIRDRETKAVAEATKQLTVGRWHPWLNPDGSVRFKGSLQDTLPCNF